MGSRALLEDKYTVYCERCGLAQIDPHRRPAQRYILGKPCPRCGHVRPGGQRRVTVKEDRNDCAG